MWAYTPASSPTGWQMWLCAPVPSFVGSFSVVKHSILMCSLEVFPTDVLGGLCCFRSYIITNLGKAQFPLHSGAAVGYAVL